MIDHVSLKVSQFSRSLRFYQAALGALGFEPQSIDEAGESAGFGPPREPCLWLGPGTGSPTHIAFRARSRAEVNEFHAAALASGGKDNGAPGVRADYSPRYYAAFVLDPDGNNIEAVTYVD